MVVVSSDEVPGQEILPLEGTVADHERILNATAVYANAPWYATSRLKRDKAFAMKLVMVDGHSLCFLDSTLQRDIDGGCCLSRSPSESYVM